MKQMGGLNEKCAVVGLATEDDVSTSYLARNSLFAQQHRGTEATGMVSYQPDGTIEVKRKAGMVRDVYDQEDIARLSGNLVIGHNRYGTSGSDKHQGPWYSEAMAFAVGMNGNLPVMRQLDTYLEKNGVSNVGRFNDADKMGLALAQQISNGHNLPDAIELTYPMLRGAFSCVGLHHDMVVGYRDPKGIRPLAIGQLNGGFMLSSETCGLDIVGADYVREVKPGELVVITKDGVESRQLADGEEKLDMFEFVYFSRHDSMLYDQRVHQVRRRFGEQLAAQHGAIYDDTSRVLVVPIPDTSVPAASGYAHALGLERDEAVIKNRYIGRTFMAPNQQARHEQLRHKHNIIPEMVKGRDLIFIDDSIARLNTMPRLVELAKYCGARTVSVLIHSPPVRWSDHYGIDTPSQSELPASYMTTEEMKQLIGCEYLGFLSLSRMIEATGEPYDKFTLSCFNGEYPIGIGHLKEQIRTPVSTEYLD